MSAIFDLHCDTLTGLMAPDRGPDTLNDPRSAFALCRLPQGQSWAQTPQQAQALASIFASFFSPSKEMAGQPSFMQLLQPMHLSVSTV